MAGGKSTPKKDNKMKVSGGQHVKTGKILCRTVDTYKAGKNVLGRGCLYAAVDGTIAFTRKKTPKGSVRTFINVLPAK
ncbi:MAG: 50S ribosomal protein L27 [Candidatus Omnitrophica bacterium]|nr:50S ribosomal protein L27 [Candidatus Omnitrophota bacterium]